MVAGLCAALGLMFIAGGLAGCGFQPLYAKPDESASIGPVNDLASVYVMPLRDRTGQIFHNYLRDRLNPRGLPGDPAYVLRIRLTETTEQLAIRSDETATRANLRLRASFSLSRRDNDQQLFEGVTNAITSYNILSSQFATYTSEQDARNRGLRELSERVRLQLATFFNRARSGASAAGGTQ
ncbi:MAG: LPS assembly lipoprotein LptE [Kiloniellales bacterium]